MTDQNPYPQQTSYQQSAYQQAPQYDPAAMNRAMLQYDDRKKSTGVTWVLWLFLGALGGHRYYLGDTGMGIAMTLTLGGLGFWALIDAFFIPRRLREKNQVIRQQVFASNGIANMA
ncbi:TM2 domain-containing protein [Corynebacterium variabile]|uniref:TM2 domain-containing protein n=1 Tax=Corynebacterium variabile TaxID=1727 RepID=UPI0026474ADE|nr:TM2 domain-containing protein [Corynebacterium variabile]MDN6242157.1 TM2 domain-containing protein [Corynebacterium variabile]MDN6477687.1 TM2 domain-containing protein [Corynebacterium variabile]MDN6678018.1 TM2 domain-containing protein [Corynebacterium variabile]